MPIRGFREAVQRLLAQQRSAAMAPARTASSAARTGRAYADRGQRLVRSELRTVARRAGATRRPPPART
jgi:hypothetical protein